MAALRLAPAAAVIEAGLRRGAPVLPLGQRRQGKRGQDLPRRDRGRLGVPMGAGRRGEHDRQRQTALLRLLSRGVRPRPVRGVHRPARRRRRAHRSRRHALPVRGPAASRWLDAAQLAGERQGGAGHWRRPARRDVVSDPDGLAVGPRGRSRPVPEARDPGGRLPRRPRPDRRSRALGGAERLLAVDDRRRDRRA